MPNGSEQEESVITSEEEGQLGEEEESSSPTNQNSPPDGPGSGSEEIVVPAEGAPNFQHPMLKGKTPEEIDRLFGAMEDANRDQNVELNRLHSQVTKQPAAPAPVQEEEDEGYGDDFMAPRFKKMEERLGRTMQRMIEPLAERLSTGAATSAREKLRSSLPNFKVLEPHIDGLIRQQGLDPATADEDTLTNLYYMARGVAADRGLNLNEGAAPAPTRQEERTTEERPVSIPQHRPSSAPLPEPAKGKQRPLSENERRLAREMFGKEKDPEKAYREWQTMDEEAVVEPGFSKEGW